MSKVVDLVGQVFTRLTVLENDGTRIRGSIGWKCLCSCGKITHVVGWDLKAGKAKSCGCYANDMRGTYTITHGRTETPEYVIWTDLFQRCYNKKRAAFKNYGGRGITVCERWQKFENFLEDMGTRPALDYTLDRIDNDRGYSKDNCKWSTRIEQANNKRNNIWIDYKGTAKTICDWERFLNFNPHVLYQRIFIYKWDVEKAFNTPMRTN